MLKRISYAWVGILYLEKGNWVLEVFIYFKIDLFKKNQHDVKIQTHEISVDYVIIL